MTPLIFSPSFMGTRSIDSTMSSVPSIWIANSTSCALGVRSDSPVAATRPVIPSPISVTRSSRRSSSYSLKSWPRKAIGMSVCSSSRSTYTRQLW